MNTIASSVIDDGNEESVTSKRLTTITRYKLEEYVGNGCRDDHCTNGSVSPDIVPGDDHQVNCLARDERVDDKLHDRCHSSDSIAQLLGRKRSSVESSPDAAECHECQVASQDERLKQIPDEEQSSDKMDLDLPDVVPERTEGTAQKLVASGDEEEDEENEEKMPTPPLLNVDGKICAVPLRSVLKKINSGKKNLRVSFCDRPLLYAEPAPLPNLMMFWDSDFDNCWDECIVADDKESAAQRGPIADGESEATSLSNASSADDKNVILQGPFLTTANVYHHDKLTAIEVSADSDSETNSSQDTVILMTSEESKRNRELIQQSQRRFEQQKPSGCKEDLDTLGSSAVLRSNSAVRKCLERTALRRSLTQCSDIKRKTRENNSKQTRQVSVMEKLRQLTKDADCAKEGEIDDGDVGERSADVARSLPRLDLRQVHDLMNEHCPLRQMYSETRGEDISVPRDIRQWKLRSKLWEQNDNRCFEEESESNYSSDENVEWARETTADELEQFVQRDWERIERVRQRYHLDGNDAFLELCSRRPSVRGIRPRFGSTTQIINQLQQQLQPPPLLTHGVHRSWPNANRPTEEATHPRHQPQQQSVPQLSVNNNNEHVSRRMNVNTLVVQQNNRFVSDV